MSDTNTNTYMVTVKAEAGGEMEMVEVTVMVTNVVELGMLTGPDSASHPENSMDTVANLHGLGRRWHHSQLEFEPVLTAATSRSTVRT